MLAQLIEFEQIGKSSDRFQPAALHTSYANCVQLKFDRWPMRYVSYKVGASIVLVGYQQTCTIHGHVNFKYDFIRQKIMTIMTMNLVTSQQLQYVVRKKVSG